MRRRIIVLLLHLLIDDSTEKSGDAIGKNEIID